MATSSNNKQPAKQIASEVLRKARGPLHTEEIAKRVLTSGRTDLKRKTPEATINASLAVGSKPGAPFTRVDKGIYSLADATPAPAKPKRNPTRRASPTGSTN